MNTYAHSGTSGRRLCFALYLLALVEKMKAKRLEKEALPDPDVENAKRSPPRVDPTSECFSSPPPAPPAPVESVAPAPPLTPPVSKPPPPPPAAEILCLGEKALPDPDVQKALPDP